MTTSASRIRSHRRPPPASRRSESAPASPREDIANQAPAPVASPHARRRGGQPGNTNRLVHGYYSRRLPRQWTSPPNPRTGLDPRFEIALARVRLAHLLDEQLKAPRKHYLAYERLILDYLGRIATLVKIARKRRRAHPDLEQLLDELRHSPDLTEDTEGPIRTTFEPLATMLGLPVFDPWAPYSNFFQKPVQKMR